MLIMKIPFFSALFKQSRRAGPNFAVMIGANGVHFAQLKYVAGRPQVVNYSFHQVGGMKSVGITSAVLDRLRKDARLGNVQFSTLLSSGEYQLMLVDAPNVPEEEMKAAVRWSIKDTLSYHVDDAVLDVLRIPSGQAAGERSKSLYVVAAAKELIKKRIDLFKRAQMNLGVIDIPEMAQRNIAALYEQQGRALALLALDESGGLLTFTSGGELFLARRIEISSGQLQDANESLRQQSLDRLELEMQRSIDHFDRQFKNITVNKLLVSAPESAELAERLGHNLGLPVERLNLSEVMDLGDAPELAGDAAQAYALHALGAALRQEGRSS
jgi:MSHA biogenesis protein MshI